MLKMSAKTLYWSFALVVTHPATPKKNHWYIIEDVAELFAYLSGGQPPSGNLNNIKQNLFINVSKQNKSATVTTKLSMKKNTQNVICVYLTDLSFSTICSL